MWKYLLLPIVVCSLVSGCSRKPSDSQKAPKQIDYINAVIMTNANVYCIMDIKASHDTPWGRFAANRKGKDNGNKLQDMMNQYTGIKSEDMDLMVMCFRSDDTADIMTMKEKTASLGLESAKGSAGLRLSKPVTLSTIKTTLLSQSNATEYARIEEISMGGMPTLKATPEDNTNSAVFLSLAGDGKTLLLSMNEASHSATLARASGSMQQLAPALAAEIAAMPKAAQTKVVMIVPDSVRKNIRNRIAESQKSTQKGPGLGLGAGIMKPFQNLQNVGLSIQTSTNLELCLYGNLGAETEASQTAVLLQSLVIPLVSMGINAQAQKNGLPMIDINNYLSVSSTGATLRLNLNISTNDIGLLDMAKMLSPAINRK